MEAEAAQQLGQVLLNAGEARAARPLLDRALALCRVTEADISPWQAEARIGLSECLIALGDCKAVRALIDQAEHIHAVQVDLGARFGRRSGWSRRA